MNQLEVFVLFCLFGHQVRMETSGQDEVSSVMGKHFIYKIGFCTSGT